MKIKRRIKIITETERRLTVSVSKKPKQFFCTDCNARAEMFSINEAAHHTHKSWREVVRLIESEEIHSTETANGEVYICAASISKI